MVVFTGCITDKGSYKKKNQDRAVCHVGGDKKAPWLVACVCDGIGSFAQSEIAAEMVTNGITNWFHGMEKLYPKKLNEDTLLEDLEMTLRELNELVCEYRGENAIDIGCTMSVLLLLGRNYYIFHAGDSRIYLVRGGLYQITRDEVCMVEKDGRMKSLLANYIGRNPQLWMSKLGDAVQEGDMLLMGSDGLFKRLVYKDVADCAGGIKNDKKAQKACEALLQTVMGRGETDNISCIMIYISSL